MKKIVKRREPTELRDHRKRGGQFDDVQGESRWKDRVREALLHEQGYLCCYCMQAVTADATKIEHFRCQERHPELALNHDNLLAACLGGQGLPGHLQHCDTAKANRDITIDPTGNPELHVRYTSDGKVRSDDPTVHHDLTEVLKLNAPDLVRARKQVIDGLVHALSARLGARGTWKAGDIDTWLQRWRAREDDRFLPFAQLGVYLLEKWRRRA